MSTGLNLSSLRDKISSKLKDSSKPSKKVSKKAPAAKKETKKDSKKSEEDEVLRREALALGATEDDLALVDGIEDGEASEQEFGGDGKTDAKFKDDFNKLLKDIGLDKIQVEDEADDSVYLSAQEDEAEEAQEEDSEPEAEPEAKSDSEDLIPEEAEEEDDNESQEESDSAPSEPEKPSTLKKNADFVEKLTLVNESKLLVPLGTWYALLEEVPSEQLSQDEIEKLYVRGQTALEQDNQTYQDEFTKNSSQKKFMSQILSDGTLNDKISALTLMIQEAPLHNTKALDTLIGFCSKKSRTAAMQSLTALKDLLLNGVMPDRKLRYFKNQPLNKQLSQRQLALYYFEDYLKKCFFKVLEILERLTHDPIIYVRMNVVSHIFDFLSAKPEQEFNLLRLGVNKLGDIDNKVAAKTSFQLLKLEQAHPNMKAVIIDAITDMVFKKNVDYHATYYSVLTLNQTILKRSEDDIANTLVKAYFSLFEKNLVANDANEKDAEVKATHKGHHDKRKNFKKGKKGGKSVAAKTEQEVVEEKNAKLFSAVLTGLNRAFPFSSLSTEIYEKHLNSLFTITHSTNFNTSVQALVLIFQVTSKTEISSDRYYRTLYESLLDPRLQMSSKQGIYLNLLYKSLKADKDINRVLAFVKRILQICTHWLNIGAIAGMFFLISQLEKTVPQIRNLFTNTPIDDEYASDNEEESEEQKQYDSRKRDPKYANADKSSLWELQHFINHFHPTVAAHAQGLVEQEELTKPDLGLFTLAHFLDRFVYRNAKQKQTTRGSSIMQPLGGAHTGDLLVKASDKFLNEMPANTEDWLNKKVEDIKPDEMFFHQYFTSKGNIKKASEDFKDAFDEQSDLDEDEVWDALVKSRPEVEEGEEESDEFDEEDFSMDDSEDDEEVNMEDLDGSEGSDIELETIGFDDEEAGEDSDNAEAAESAEESEDEEAELFKGDSDEEVSSEEEVDTKKRPADDDKESSKKKKKLKDLPVFASADDYAQYLQSDDEF